MSKILIFFFFKSNMTKRINNYPTCLCCVSVFCIFTTQSDINNINCFEKMMNTFSNFKQLSDKCIGF